MVWSRDLPHSFSEAIQVSVEMLEKSSIILARGTALVEAEQIVIAAYREAMPDKATLTRLDLYSRARDRLPEKAGELVLTFSGARASGKLLQHLTGVQVFLEHEYQVGPGALVPRPETEILVTHAIEILRAMSRPPVRGAEIGLGSGVISIELLAAFPGLQITASEIEPAATTLATRNAQLILGGLDRLHMMTPASATEVLSSRFPRGIDFLISNPPYVAERDAIDADVLEHEPRSALFSANGDPLWFYREIAQNAAEHLVPGGWVFVELAHERAAEIDGIFAIAGWEAQMVPDLNDRPRVLAARKKGGLHG